MIWNEKTLSRLPSPCYIIDCDALKSNLSAMKRHCDYLGIKPLIAIKGFPLALLFRDMAPYICGISASSPFEARLGLHLGKEVHIHAPAYKDEDIKSITPWCDYIVFNSLSQLNRYKNILLDNAHFINIGLRINLEYSEALVDKYNPCMPYSRFGVTCKMLEHQNITDVSGFHVHTMYDNDAEAFARVIDVFTDKFEKYLSGLSWINFGGGQHLADDNYQVSILQERISHLKTAYALDIYVEPCEGIVTDSGYLLSTVLDIIENEKPTAILDTSAICHMPDVLETPYRPDIALPLNGNHRSYNYVLAGVSCMAGDLIGEYNFNAPLKIGDKVLFSGMGAYTFAKESYFNGINHPPIVLYDQINGFHIKKTFSYHDYESQYM